MSHRRRTHVSSLVALLAAAGCQASIGSDQDQDQPSSPTSAGPKSTTAIPSDVVPVEARVWRLTRAQYDNTVHDLLGDTSGPGKSFLPEEGGTGFDNAELTLGFKDTNMADFNRAAQKLAADAVGTTARLNAVFACGEAKLADDSCGKQFVVDFGRRTFRRPLTADETTRYQALFAGAKQKLDPRSAVQAVIETMLQSPNFLFRVEAGDGKPDSRGRVHLTAHEVAAQLSYYLWNTMPDDALAAAADGGKLLDAAELERQARRMLDDARARATVSDFFLQMMQYRGIADLNKSGTYATPFGKAKPSLADETMRFVQEVLWNDDATFDKLIAAPYTMGNAAIAAVYGVTAPSGTSWTRLTLDSKDRAGLLTQPGLMAVTSHPEGTSPVLRGKFVAEQVLCATVPDPPPEVMAVEPPPSTSRTTRQRYEAHATNPSCSACHKLLDAPGYAFEHLDPVGRVRRTENGVAVDTSGALTATDVDGAFTGIADLAHRLAGSTQARTCLARQLFRYAGGRREGNADDGAIADLTARFGKASWNVKELFVAQVLSPRFVVRQAN